MASSTEGPSRARSSASFSSLPYDVRGCLWASLSTRSASVLSCTCHAYRGELVHAVASNKAKTLAREFEDFVRTRVALVPLGAPRSEAPFFLTFVRSPAARGVEKTRSTIFWSYIVLVDGEVDLRTEEKAGERAVVVRPSLEAPSDAQEAWRWLPLVLAKFVGRTSLLGPSFRASHFEFASADGPDEATSSTRDRWSRRTLPPCGTTIVYPTYVRVRAVFEWGNGVEMSLVGRIPFSSLAENLFYVAKDDMRREAYRLRFAEKVAFVAWQDITLSVKATG